jgi:hypothetical protein
MIEPRLASYIRVSALSRMANSNGDSFMVLRRGDEIAGAILLITAVRGVNTNIFEYVTDFDGVGQWRPIRLESDVSQRNIDAYCEKRHKRDPDIWLIELSIADGERLNLYLDSSA